MEAKYLGDFSDQADVENQFEMKLGPDKKILLAAYDGGGYEGDAWVLVQHVDSGKLFEVNGSHCSCCGLEGQWDEEETSVQSLRNRLKNGHVGPYDYPVDESLTEVLNRLYF